MSLNNFNYSTIPRGIGRLSKLTHLNLTLSNFTGQVPLEVMQLSKLVSLSIGENLLMLRDPSLKDITERLTNLSELHLSYVNISSRVPQSLSNLTSLTSLLLGDCSLQGEFPPAIFQLPNLRVLSLMYNQELTGYLPELHVGNRLETLRLDATNFSGQLPKSIGNFKSLSSFSAQGCGFVGLIPSSIGNLTKLKFLDLSRNHFSGKIPSYLSNLLQLTYLSLSYNNFSSSTFPWLGKLTNLQSVGLKKAELDGFIPASLRNLTKLTTLKLYSNHLTGSIPSWIGNLTGLVNLDFGDNELNSQIPESIFRLPNLEGLGLGANKFCGSLKPDSFLQMKFLSSLELSRNHLSLVNSPYINVTTPKLKLLGLGTCNLTEFPSFLRGQNELEYLELSSNKIKGYVPKWISTLESLSDLGLGNNSFTGFEDPLGIHSLPTLQVLYATVNAFEGPLPIPPPSIVNYDVSLSKFSGDISPLFCNLTFLSALDLSGNNLSGDLPPCLANLGSSTLVLNLRNNNLSGKIPDNFMSGCVLKLMDWSHNKFEGKLPRSLASCSNLEILNLEGNQIDDVFPSWLGILPRLRVFSLRSNKFHGTIGKPLGEFEFDQLQIIDLSDNYFTGKLPSEYLQNWSAMKNIDDSHLTYMNTIISFTQSTYSWYTKYPYSIEIVIKGTKRAYGILEFFVFVDLSSNKFEGEIPEIFGTLRELQSLNFSNNMLTGHIPSSLGNLTKLEALDLSLNNLSGEIPTQLAFLTFLAVFNVSQNSLTGPVPRGRQFDTFENNSFLGNPGLCGDRLPRKCGDTKTLTLPPSEEDEDEDEDSPFEFSWEMMLIGCGGGLVMGVAFGVAMDTRKYEWLVRRKFARWRRSLRN